MAKRAHGDGNCAYLRIGAEIRRAIEAGEYAPGCRIPTVQELAKRHGTSVFTIQTALLPLENDGLIERKRKVGIFVRGAKARLSRLGIYYGGRDIWREGDFEFLRRLHGVLTEKLGEMGLAHSVFIDDRPLAASSIPYQPLARAVEKGEIQALAVLEMDGERRRWLKELPVPMATHARVNSVGQVHFDFNSFVEGALRIVKQKGRGRPALITHLRSMADSWRRLCPELGLELRPGWLLLSESENMDRSLQSFGYEQALKLAEMEDRPDSVVIFPDTAASGVVTGILARRLRVPEDLLVVMHRNEGVDCPCPFPAVFAVASIQDMAAKIIDQILVGMQGLEQTPILASFKFEEFD